MVWVYFLLCCRQSFLNQPFNEDVEINRKILNSLCNYVQTSFVGWKDQTQATVAVTWKMHCKNNHKYEVWESINEKSVAQTGNQRPNRAKACQTDKIQSLSQIGEETQAVEYFPHTFVRFSQGGRLTFLLRPIKSSPQFGSVNEKIGWNSKS